MIKFLIDIAVLHTLFYFIWTYLFTLPIVGVSTLLKINTWGVRVSKGLGAIVFGSMSSVIVLQHATEISNLVFYSLTAGLFMFFNLVSGSAQAKQNVKEEVNIWNRMEMESELNYDFIYWIMAVGIFVLTFFFPIIGDNPINLLFIFLMNWIMEIPIINWIVIGISLLLLLTFIWKGFFGLLFLISSINSRRGKA